MIVNVVASASDESAETAMDKMACQLDTISTETNDAEELVNEETNYVVSLSINLKAWMVTMSG